MSVAGVETSGESEVEAESPAQGHAPASAGDAPAKGAARAGAEDEAPAFGPILLFWMAVVVLIHGTLWLTGFRTTGLSVAVEEGAARAESRFIGEVGDDVIRKAVRTQHDTLPFWTVLRLRGDFLGEPVILAIRALGVATAFAAVAALMGRPIGYDRALADCSSAQGYWVLGLAVHAGLMIVLRRAEVETSAALLLPAGQYPAWLWLAVRQIDAFALIGWCVLALGGLRRRQVRPFAAVMVCGGFWLAEAALRIGLGVTIGSAMRLAVMPA